MCPLFFIKFLFFHQMIALQKLWKMFFVSSKKLFSFSRYANFYNFFSSFPHFPDAKDHLPCAQGSYLYYAKWLYIYIYMINWIIQWYQKFTFHNVFPFQKVFNCKLFICWLDAKRLVPSCETQIILIEMVK